MLLKFSRRKNASRTFAGLLAPLLLSVFLFSACSTTKPLAVAPTPTPRAIPTATPGVTPTLAAPQIVPRGKGEVLYLTNKSGLVVHGGGMFYASRAYTVFALCTGTGNLTVELAPQGEASFICSQQPQLQGDTYGNAQAPPPQENIQVAVIPQGNIVWEVSIHLH